MKRPPRAFAATLCALLALVPLAAQEDWFWGKPIASIQWIGTRNADRRELDSAVKPYIGKQFTESLWLDLQAGIYALDLFESIEPEAFPSDDTRTKVLIKFTVKEKPSVESLRVAGNSGLRSGDILDVVKLKVGDIYNASTARLDELAVRRLYAEKGYPDATVGLSTEPGKLPGGIQVVFTVSEGSQVAVKEILFAGNAAIGAQVLKSQLQLKEAGLFQSGIFQESLLEADKAKLLQYYRGRGYMDAVVVDVLRDYRKDEKSGKNWLFLTFSIREGIQWLYGGANVEGNRIFPTERLASFFAQKPGTVLNYNKLVLEKSRLDDLYYENGYIFNNIELLERRDEAKSEISFTVRIVERDRAHIESIVFKGNKRTKEEVMARELPLQVGDIFSKARIIEGLRNLYNLQYFSAIEPEMLPGSAENLMNLVINVEEQSTMDLQFGVTLSGLGQPDTFPISGQIKFNDRNFMGGGQTAGVELVASPTEQKFSLNFLDRWLFGERISGGVDLSFEHKSLTAAQDLAYPRFEDGVPDPYDSLDDYKNAGSSVPDEYKMPYDSWDLTLGLSGGITLKYPFGDLGLGAGFSTGLGTVTYDETKYRPASKELRDSRGEATLSNRLSARVSLNRLDLWYNPGKGYYASQRLTLAGLLPGGLESKRFLRSDTRLEAYATLFSIPLFEAWNFKSVFGVHASHGLIFKQPWDSASDPSPGSSDYLRIDGSFVGRGWSSLSTYQGLQLLEAWAELRFPIVESVAWIDTFLDAAALRTDTGFVGVSDKLDNDDALGLGNFAFSLGAGLRFTIPQFPFRFYFAWPFSWNPAAGALEFKKDANGKVAPTFVISISQALN